MKTCCHSASSPSRALLGSKMHHDSPGPNTVLQGLTPEPGTRNAAQQIWRYIATNPFEQPPLGWITTADYMICDVRRFVRTFRYMLQDRIEEKLPKVQAPALVVRGTRDQIVSQRWAEQVTRLLSNAQLAIIPSAGHAINFSNPVEFKKVLIPFLLGSEPAQETEST